MWAHTNIQKHTHTKFKSWGPMDEDHPTSSAKIGNYRGNMQTYIPTHHLSPQKKKIIHTNIITYARHTKGLK